MAFDNELMYRTTGSLTTNASLGPVTHRDTGIRGMGVRISVPSSTEATAELLARVWVSADNSTYTLKCTAEAGYQTASGGLEFYIPLSTTKKYSKLELLVSGTTPNFGAVQAGLVLEQRGIDRTTNFE